MGKITHGKSKTAIEYPVWEGMRGRCRNPRNAAYNDYGGRGIKVCERWDDFSAFVSDVGPRPSMEHSLDRMDVNGDYEPSNCRWVTQTIQNINKRKLRETPSGCTGVCWHKRTKMWAVYINVNKKRIWLGRFLDKDAAIEKRKLAELIYHKPLLLDRKCSEQC